MSSSIIAGALPITSTPILTLCSVYYVTADGPSLPDAMQFPAEDGLNAAESLLLQTMLLFELFALRPIEVPYIRDPTLWPKKLCDDLYPVTTMLVRLLTCLEHEGPLLTPLFGHILARYRLPSRNAFPSRLLDVPLPHWANAGVVEYLTSRNPFELLNLQ